MMPFNRMSQPRAAWTAPGLGSHQALPIYHSIEAGNDVLARQNVGYRVTVQVAIRWIAGGVIILSPPAVGNDPDKDFHPMRIFAQSTPDYYRIRRTVGHLGDNSHRVKILIRIIIGPTAGGEPISGQYRIVSGRCQVFGVRFE